jgi:hypothetical protein
MKLINCLILFSLIFSFSCSKKELKYVIENYNATFEIADNNCDVNVNLEIKYRIESGKKSDGFKYVGNGDIENLQCIDDSGNKLKIEMVMQREKKLMWYFEPVSEGYKKISVGFKLKNFIILQGNLHTLTCDWVGVFQVPVEKSMFIVKFPDGIKPSIIDVNPKNFENNIDKSGQINIVQSPLISKGLRIEYKLAK